MSSFLENILAPATDNVPAQPLLSTAHEPTAIEPANTNVMPPPQAVPRHDEQAEDTPKEDGQDELHTSTTATTRRNASGSVSSVYSGNKIRHLKKEDGIPLWRKDIQYDFLRLVFYDPTRCFTKYSDGTKGWTFAETYIDAMAKSSKCSKILKEKLLQDTEGAIAMAMVCLLVNVGRMNTTLNFFPEMRAQLRTYHSIPALQAHQDPNAYKQLQDAPRLKSILKGATEDDPQPSTMEEVRAKQRPRTNPVNLIFVMSQYAPKISETHFSPPRDFFDLVMRGSLSSASRARAFLWLIWWYLESDFGYEDSQSNPFGKGRYGEGEEGTDALPLRAPPLESLTEEQAALENIDTEEEERFGEIKRKERIAILASEPSPAMTALKRARKEKGIFSARDGNRSDDDLSESGWPRHASASASGRAAGYDGNGSEYTRSPTPPASRGFQAVNAPPPPPPAGDMRINNVLNDDSPEEVPAAPSTSSKKGPGRGNWRRNRTKQETVPLAVRGTENSHHVPLLPNNGHFNFINEGPNVPMQPATPGSSSYGPYGNGLSNHSPHQSLTFQPPSTRDHIPTPSYQATKRNRGVTQHQSALITHRRQQIDWMLDRRLRRVHARARDARESEGAILRAWKRIRLLPADYDSEEEIIKARKAREKSEKDDDWRTMKGKDPLETADEMEANRRPRVLLAGMATLANGDSPDVGEEPRSLARTLRRASRRLERWQEINLPGQAMQRRRQMQMQQMHGMQGVQYPQRQRAPTREQNSHFGGPPMQPEYRPRQAVVRQRSSTGRMSEQRPAPVRKESQQDQRMGYECYDDEAGVELDEEERELLGEVDADEEDSDEDDEMGED
ncbi:hypothetical protein LTR97_010170 [Elasticomyces elasticus]|uniref:Ino eighty subunit 1 n=1 Tax=Elasticomyces elasticus TaxID=574655 RepID=A0AAN7W0K8_9PEZI|nr:hypothetical protein LTR97_010170 [Elasticomyces elasticus]